MARVAARARRALGLGALLASLAVVAGCSLNETLADASRVDYKSAGKLPPLDIPPDLVTPRGDDRFSIPDRGPRTLSGYQSARNAERPAGESRVLPAAQGMRIERAGTQRWLVVNQPPAKLWPLVKEFWQESGFIVQSESPEIGIMETDWAENRAKIPQDFIRRTIGRAFDALYSSGERDKFRTRLEAVQGGTEIYISHRGMEEVYTSLQKDETRWQPRPPDPELEAEFLGRLVVKLGGDQERAKSMLASTAQPGQERARIVGPADRQVVEIAEGFDRAWRRVGLALDRGGFTVEDRDRSQGFYFVRYIDPEADNAPKPGFFSRLFSRSSDKTAGAQQYRVKVAGAGESTQVSVLGKDGQPLAAEADRKTGTRILALLRDQLQQ
ncbi:MAG: outer membrane protein assembly factor BamC [Burkholderiaceae bacterium]